MRHWPLTQLTITTPDLVLRVPDDQLLDKLAHLAGQGVHPPEMTVFAQPWTTGTPEEVARNVLRNHWWARADWRGDNWRLHLTAVNRDGHVVGQQNLSARDFATTREARTGFWVGRRHHNRGYGTQMRAAALHLAFALGAERVISTAFAHNGPSRAISAKFGSVPNGIRRIAVDGQLIHVHEFVITRDQSAAQVQPGISVQGLDACRTMFDLPSSRCVRAPVT
ncbi:GNAT family protein [Actinomadura meridiana]|uniref:GNAT family protein n=1 Tax=Actinomadura meridiana TaxID=559626 RepID=A0ABP8CIR9_9ACTN